ncbi:MAG: phosphate acyltransferase PlsX [Clostridia bacterium]|nr:phosphate acyltransferase PlsX [Clostridia bacterium]
MKIVVDIYGADNSPGALVEGCVRAQKGMPALELVMTGNEVEIRSEIKKYGGDASRIEIVDAPEVVTNDESPTMAIRQKKNSSLVRALEILKTRDDVGGMLSSGSTGAVLSGAIFKVGRLDGVLRPALAPLLPTANGSNVCLVDCGANVDCRPEFLVQFALMGVSYMRTMYGIENPRVGLVSVGVEDHKGNELTKEVFTRLKALPINFVGNMEARYALTGDYDVLVADGFVGNTLLKSTEGTASMVMKLLKDAILSSTSAKIGALFMKSAFKKLKHDMDYNTLGGAPFLGIEKVIVKGHGSSNAVAVEAAIKQVAKMAEGNLPANILQELKKLEAAGANA